MVLYCSKFQAALLRMESNHRVDLDRIIKDYIGQIRRKRDVMYRAGQLPINAIVETTTYKPQLWKRGRQHNGDLRGRPRPTL